jgi:hypothetical protein
LTPKLHSPSERFGPFSHSGQAKVPGTATAIDDACLDTTSIISNAQNKETTAVGDFSFNILSVCVVERIY